MPDPSLPLVAPIVSNEEMDAVIAALKPPKRQRPLVAIVAINDATETTDYLVPTGILRRAGVADVVMLASGPGPVRLFPALTVEADTTVAAFDAQYPEGADYVVVPGMSRDDDPVVLDWLRSQAAKQAIVLGVCTGAKVVGAAGLLDGRRATTHWYYVRDLLRRSPSIRYVPDRRFVMDGRIATTTGISASMPMMLTLIEAIAGRARAEAAARDLGIARWDARHTSAAFRLTRRFATTVVANRLAFWRRERIGIEVKPGVDEVSLALVADAWTRTYRSKAETFSADGSAIETRSGVRLVPDVDATGSRATVVSSDPERKPADALDQVLRTIGERFGDRTAEVVAMQLEYDRTQRRG